MRKATLLKLLFLGILLAMLGVTIWASLQISLWEAWPEYRKDPWAIATLLDAYFGFITFFVWLAWRERKTITRVVWFALVMCLGNIAMAVYILIQLQNLSPDEVPSALFSRKPE